MCDRTGQDLIVINPAAKENTQSNLSLSLHTHMLTHRRSCSHPYACAQVYIICMCAHALTFYILLHSLRYTGSLNTHMSTQVTCTITHIQALVFIHCIFMCALAIHSNVHTYIHTFVHKVCSACTHTIQELAPVQEFKLCPAAFIQRVLTIPR